MEGKPREQSELLWLHLDPPCLGPSCYLVGSLLCTVQGIWHTGTLNNTPCFQGSHCVLTIDHFDIMVTNISRVHEPGTKIVISAQEHIARSF